MEEQLQLSPTAAQSQVKKILNKIENPREIKVEVSKTLKSKKTSIEDKLSLIYSEVDRILGGYKENTQVIRTGEELQRYLNTAIRNNVIAIDTETNNSLDPLTCKLMGVCIYTPGERNAYIPINHVNRETGELLPNQLKEADIKRLFAQLDNVFTITHNGTFDYEVLKCTTGWDMHIDWDTMIGARLLNENERAGLKAQYIDKIDPSIEKYSIESLFSDVEYAAVDPDVFALYAATDSYMTYKLYKYQEGIFNKPENSKLFNLFKTVEIPIMPVAAKMELRGITIDTDYAERLSKYYNDKLNSVDAEIQGELLKFESQIEKWRNTPGANEHPVKNGKIQKSKNEQLKSPVVITSPAQLAILIYDVLKLPPVGESARGTDEATIQKLIDKGFTFGNLILKKRGLIKLINTYIDKFPKMLDKSNRLHGHFNTLGTDTGRFSSTEPNLQNIPSHEQLIRLMFAAKPGYNLVGSDFSQQEPRLLAHYANDKSMIDAYKNKKDLYATVASLVYGNGYWDNMEHFEDGTPNPEGKKRRSNCKSIVLGLLYGRGTNSVAEQIGSTFEEAQQLIDKFFAGFPTVHTWIQNTQDSAYENGYVEDVLGRRRRLPDLSLPKFEVLSGNWSAKSLRAYNKLNVATSYKQRKELIEELKKEGMEIKDNSGFISRAERQCVNARVQGGAATITKLAMISVDKDPILKDLDFSLLLCIHDELIGECPRENAERAADRLSQLMIEAAATVCSVPMKCDATITSHWYEEEVIDSIHEEYTKLVESVGEGGAAAQIKSKYSLIKEDALDLILSGMYKCDMQNNI